MKKHYKTTKKLQINTNTPPPIIITTPTHHHPINKNKMMTTHLTSREAIRERNLQMERQSILNERARRRRARAMARRARANAPHVEVLLRGLAPRVEAQARAAVAAARAAVAAAEAAAEAGRALQALQAELRKAMHFEIGPEFATYWWHSSSNGFGDAFVAHAERIATDAKRSARAAGRIESHAAVIVKSVELFSAAADADMAADNDNNDGALAENE